VILIAEDTLDHESSHVAAAWCLGVAIASVEFDRGGFDGWRGIVSTIPDDHPPIHRAMIAYAPVLATMRGLLESQDPHFAGDLENVERLRPSHWPPDVWLFHVADKTREMVATDEFRQRYADAMALLEEPCRMNRNVDRSELEEASA
jgi:hypothetical protein